MTRSSPPFFVIVSTFPIPFYTDIGWKTLRKLFRSPHLILHLRETAEAQLELITTSAELKKVMGDHAYDSLVQKVRREVSSDHEHDVGVLSLLRERIMRKVKPGRSGVVRSFKNNAEPELSDPVDVQFDRIRHLDALLMDSPVHRSTLSGTSRLLRRHLAVEHNGAIRDLKRELWQARAKIEKLETEKLVPLKKEAEVIDLDREALVAADPKDDVQTIMEKTSKKFKNDTSSLKRSEVPGDGSCILSAMHLIRTGSQPTVGEKLQLYEDIRSFCEGKGFEGDPFSEMPGSPFPWADHEAIQASVELSHTPVIITQIEEDLTCLWVHKGWEDSEFLPIQDATLDKILGLCESMKLTQFIVIENRHACVYSLPDRKRKAAAAEPEKRATRPEDVTRS
ncbi:hypothetical protein J8273_1616 [Carpediemonas membranifera]|uniref:OTU domain-containing protein n=1 Tax=Carpediemonas membranifera TaxID=201153 RepID=A0A8J6B6C9_9EUKA|nr:hypothetical protein J8273_1616 [Carpediemonas membranifera]|eukprot:KAG9396603.1 hypothetical protein J8273_1616 [Carpediemonas membranifera]